MKTFDFINKKEGPNKIKLASQDLKENLENETNQIDQEIYYRA